MILIGNDVVDLNDADAHLDKIHPRFAERVLSRAEFAFWIDSPHPRQALLWTYWAAKESAYKALSRFFPSISFSHKKFELDVRSKKVFYQHHTLDCQIDQEQNYIHVTSNMIFEKNVNHKVSYHKAVFHKKDILPKISHSTDNRNDSWLLKQKIIQKIAESNNYCQEYLKIETLSIKSRTPHLFYKNKRQNTVFSLSHHGNYLAYVFAVDSCSGEK